MTAPTAPTLLDLLLTAAVTLLLGLVVVQIRRANRVEERVAVLERWAKDQDPGYWRELLGRADSGPFVNEDPAPDVPPNCQDDGGFHVAGKGNTCANCPADLTPVRSV